jgi:hypothetical protein
MHDPIDTLLRDLGPLLDEVAAIEQLGPHLWAIGLTDGSTVTADYSEPSDKLVLATECGQPPASDRLLAYETLLAYNALWPETGGLRMALDQPGGRVVLLLDLAPQALTAVRFATVVQNFAAHARLWRQAIPDLGRTEAAPFPPPPSGLRA